VKQKKEEGMNEKRVVTERAFIEEG